MEDDLKADFLSETDDYYIKVADGIKLVESNHISEGIDVMMRPIHSIKGTSGFIAGLDVIASFTHRVEDYLKDLQCGKIPAILQIIELLMRAVDMVFQLLDQAKKSENIDGAEGQKILANIEKILNPSLSTSGAGEIVVEDKNKVPFIRINMARIHLPSQYQLLTDAFKRLENGNQLVLDLSRVCSIGSTAWGAIWEAGGKMKISLIGMNETCLTTFTIWGFDQFMDVFKSEEDFWKKSKVA